MFYMYNPDLNKKLSALQEVLGEQSKSDTLSRSIDILHSLVGCKDEHVRIEDIKPIIEQRMHGGTSASQYEREMAQIYTDFLYTFLRYKLWRPTLQDDRNPTLFALGSLISALKWVTPLSEASDTRAWAPHEGFTGYLVYSISKDDKKIGVIDGLLPMAHQHICSVGEKADFCGPNFSKLFGQLQLNYFMHAMKSRSEIFRTTSIQLGAIEGIEDLVEIPKDDKEVTEFAIRFYKDQLMPEEIDKIRVEAKVLAEFLKQQDEVRYFSSPPEQRDAYLALHWPYQWVR